MPAGAHNPWLQLLRTKKGFPLICRATFWPSMVALYSNIVLRRMGQVSALAERLRAPDVGPRLRTLVKSIRWDSCIVAAQCTDVIRADMSFILGQCTQLQSFSYNPHHQFPLRLESPNRDECEGCFNPLWFISPSDPLLLHSSALSNLRSLDLSADLRKIGIDDRDDSDAILLAIHRVLSACTGLESLTLGPWPSNSSLSNALITVSSISFPSLTHLQIFAPEGALDAYLCSHWTAPQLTHLTILISTSWSPLGLLERFGRRLRYLHIYPVRFVVPDVSSYLSTLTTTLSAVCPLLEHLVAPHCSWRLLLIDSPTLAHLDFWGSGWSLRERQDKTQADANRAWNVDARSTAPALRTVRIIFTESPATASAGSLPSYYQDGYRHAAMDPDWPWICHPRLLEKREDEDEVLFYQFPMGRVAQTVAAIIPEIFWQMSVGERECEESERDEEEGESGCEEAERLRTRSSRSIRGARRCLAVAGRASRVTTPERKKVTCSQVNALP